MRCRTYVFRLDDFELSFGTCAPENYVMLHVFSEESYIGTVRLDGSVTCDFKRLNELDMIKYWDCFE